MDHMLSGVFEERAALGSGGGKFVQFFAATAKLYTWELTEI